MVHNLADGPSASTIGSVELRFGKCFCRGPQIPRSVRDLLDQNAPFGLAKLPLVLKFSDRVSQISHYPSAVFHKEMIRPAVKVQTIDRVAVHQAIFRA
jgi:hypothetical protein